MYHKHKSYLQKTSTNKRWYITSKIIIQGWYKLQTCISFIQTLFKIQRNSYLSLKERLINLLNSHDGHFDDKQPLKGDCKNNENLDNCF
uniref:Uncharacterized protein n=1 Tax=Medicago truncatula TaxID=3880 RepID=I3SDD6_MEDTR|nr:unknown [Medicago truncatula]